MAEPGFGRITILGLGLMGGSIAAGLKQRADNIHITAWDESGAALASGLQRGLIDEAAETAASAIAGAQLVVLAVPVRANAVVLKGISLTGQVLTDVGSVKQHVIDAAREAWGDVPTAFIPGHPIAGSERHGVTAADPDLFVQHRVILTPLPESDDDALVLVKQLWGLLGADVVTMSAEHHDAVLAQTSHLPHLLAYALVDTLSSGGDSLEVFEYAAGGFRDFSRIAASDPVMWRDIFLTNPGPVLDILGRFQADLESLRTLIEAGDAVALEEVFERAKVARDHFADILQARQR